MKRSLILLVTLLITLNSYGNDLSVKLKNENLNLILSSLWDEVPYEYDFSTFFDEQLGDDVISYKIRKGNVKLANAGSALFDLSFSDSDLLTLNWNLQDLEAYIELKVRFKYRSLGVQITHDEVFIIEASKVLNATSKASIEYTNNPNFLQARFQDYQNFNLESISIEPKDGIGTVLRYIFDNIFSRRQVDKFITKAVNKELNKWLQEDHLKQEIESSINKLLTQSQQHVLDMPELATSFSVDLNKFNISGEESSLETNFIFRDGYPKHICASEISKSEKTDLSIQASHRFIETLINNVGTKLRTLDNKDLEPLFCFGFKDYDDNGEAVGNKLKTRFLGRNINLSYWVRPLTLPKYSYDPKNQEITIDLKVDVKIKTKGYPRVMTKKNPRLELRVSFKIIKDDQGLKLVYSDFLAKSIKGNVKVKWGRLAPTLNLPLKTLRLALNSSIKKELKNQNILILPNELETNDIYKLNLENYQLLKKGHKINFAIEPY
jgi:hypothetical protein